MVARELVHAFADTKTQDSPDCWTHWDDRYCPLSGLYCRLDGFAGFISKCSTTRCWLRVDRFITGRRSHVFFGTRNIQLKKLREWFLRTSSMAPLLRRLSMASCSSDFLFLIGKFMGVLVRGGDDSHFRTPDLIVCVDLHSPNRLCQAWTKPARWAPTGASSLSVERLRTSSPLLGIEGLISSLRSSGTWVLGYCLHKSCYICHPRLFQKKWGPSWFTGGPKRWWTVLATSADLGANFFGILKRVVRPRCRECLSLISKIFWSNCTMLDSRRS